MLDRNRGLFEALERVFPVRFEARTSGETGDLDARRGAWRSDRSLGCPCLIATRKPPQSESPASPWQRFASHPPRRWTLACEARSSTTHGPEASRPLAPEPGDEVLAEGPERTPLDQKGEGEGQVHRVALSPAQHDSSLPLRAQLRAGRFLSLLPLASFLGELTEPQQWPRPPLRASFVIDDPNLRWPTYGFIDFRSLAAHAAATRLSRDDRPGSARLLAGERLPPLASSRNPPSRSRSVFTDSPTAGTSWSDFDRLARLAESLPWRCGGSPSFERRAGVRVDRVMAAPHERCSAVATEAMLQLGFEALVIDRANPWRFRPQRRSRWRDGSSQSSSVAGCP